MEPELHLTEFRAVEGNITITQDLLWQSHELRGCVELYPRFPYCSHRCDPQMSVDPKGQSKQVFKGVALRQKGAPSTGCGEENGWEPGPCCHKGL